MRQSIADYQVQRMTAVLNTLRWLRDNEDRIRAAVEGAQNPEPPQDIGGVGRGK
jgi:hypothetical protein